MKKRVQVVYLLAVLAAYFSSLNAHQEKMAELLASCPHKGLKDVYDSLERRKQMLLREKLQKARTQTKANWDKLTELRDAATRMNQDILWMQQQLQESNAQG